MNRVQSPDGGPAFPSLEEHGLNNGCYGLTMRDYFAAKAIQGFCANSRHAIMDGPQEFKVAVSEAYLLADAMLAERAK